MENEPYVCGKQPQWRPKKQAGIYVPKTQEFYTLGAVENIIRKGFQRCMPLTKQGIVYERYSLAGRVATTTANGKYVNHIE